MNIFVVCILNQNCGQNNFNNINFLNFNFMQKDKPYEPFVIPCTLTEDSSLQKKYRKGTWEWVDEKRLGRGQNGFSYLTPGTGGYILRMVIQDSTLQSFRNSTF